jgi:hypothetical protein
LIWLLQVFDFQVFKKIFNRIQQFPMCRIVIPQHSGGNYTNQATEGNPAFVDVSATLRHDK